VDSKKVKMVVKDQLSADNQRQREKKFISLIKAIIFQ